MSSKTNGSFVIIIRPSPDVSKLINTEMKIHQGTGVGPISGVELSQVESFGTASILSLSESNIGLNKTYTATWQSVDDWVGESLGRNEEQGRNKGRN